MPALLALFIRSLREDTRSRAVLWTRIGLIAAVLFSVWSTQSMSRFLGNAAGLQFFESLVWMNFAFISIAGMSYFATAITEEKEESTLGLLRMTDLSPFAILLGKSTSRFVGGALLLLVQFPFALLAITLGGVRWGQVAGAYALLGGWMFFVCNAGLLASVIARRAGTAAVIAACFCFAWAIFPGPLLGAIANSIFEPDILSPKGPHHLYSIVFSLNDLLGTRGGGSTMWRTLAWLFIGGTGAFFIARSKFDTFCDDDGDATPAFTAPPPAARQPATMENTQPAPQGYIPVVARTTPRRPWDTGTVWRGDAVAWRDYQFIHGGTRVAWVKFAIYALGAVVIAGLAADTGRPGESIGTVLFFVSLFVICCECLFAASRSFRIERKEKTLSSLYILPLDLPALIRSKRRALMLTLAPVSIFLALGSLVLLFSMRGSFWRDGEALIWIIQGAAFFFADLVFNLRFVAWLSLRMKWGSLPLTLVLSWIAHAIILPLSFLMFREAFLFLLICATAVGAALMKPVLHERIEHAAAEE